MGAEDEMVFAAEKDSAGMKNWIIIGVVIVLIGLGAFFFLTNPKLTGLAVLPAGTTTPIDTQNPSNTATDKPFWEAFNPFPAPDAEDEAFTDIPLQADWTLKEHELSVENVNLLLSNSTLEDSLSKKAITEESTIMGFSGNIKLTSEGIVLSGSITGIKGAGSETTYTTPESVIITTGKISADSLTLSEFTGTVNGTFTFPKATVTVDNEPISFRGYTGSVTMENNHLVLNGNVDSFTTKTSQGSISVK